MIERTIFRSSRRAYFNTTFFAALPLFRKYKKKKKNQKQKAQEFERNAKWAVVFILIGAWTGLLGARKEVRRGWEDNEERSDDSEGKSQ